MSHEEIQHVSAPGGCPGAILHVPCGFGWFLQPTDDSDPLLSEPVDLQDYFYDFVYNGTRGGDVPGGNVGDTNPPIRPDMPVPGGGGIDSGPPHRPDTPGGGGIDTNPPGGRPDTPGGGGIDTNPPPGAVPDVPSGDVFDIPADPSAPPPRDPEAPAGDVGGIPPGVGEIAEFSFRRTADPTEYYTGDGTTADAFALPIGAVGDARRVDTVDWVTAVYADVGLPPPTFIDL